MKLKMKKIIVSLLLILLSINLYSAEKETGNTYVKVNMTTSHSEIAPGSQILLIFDFKMTKDWHIYWKNPGDAGIATRINLLVPAVFKVDEALWPIPEKMVLEDLVSYGYLDSVRVVIPVNVPKDITMKEYKITANMDWLACKVKCLVGKDSKTVTFKVAEKSVVNNKIGEISVNKYPVTVNDNRAKSSIDKEKVTVMIPVNEISDNTIIDFYPLEEGYYAYKGINLEENKSILSIYLPLDRYRESDPKSINGLLVYRRKDNNKPINSFYFSSKIK